MDSANFEFRLLLVDSLRNKASRPYRILLFNPYMGVRRNGFLLDRILTRYADQPSTAIKKACKERCLPKVKKSIKKQEITLSNKEKICNIDLSLWHYKLDILITDEKRLQAKEMWCYWRILRITLNEHGSKVLERTEPKMTLTQKTTVESFRAHNEKRRLRKFDTHRID